MKSEVENVGYLNQFLLYSNDYENRALDKTTF